MCKMREIIQSDWKSEDSSAHSQWREEALCTVQQDIQSSCYLEDSLADSLWQEATQKYTVRTELRNVTDMADISV